MLKGRESRPATEFIRKYAYLIGPIENLSAPVVKNSSPEHNNEQEPHDIFVAPTPSATTQIIFQQDDADENCDYFKELASSLSLCLRIDELECIEITRTFRSTKCDIVLSLQALYAIKHFFAKKGHVIILHILHTWFAFEIREALIDSEIDEEDFDDDGEIPLADEMEELDVVISDAENASEAEYVSDAENASVVENTSILQPDASILAADAGIFSSLVQEEYGTAASEEEASTNEDVEIDELDEEKLDDDEVLELNNDQEW